MRQKDTAPPFPRVLVLIPAFNSGPQLTRAIDSLQQDGYAHHTLVVDDGSAEPQAPYAPPLEGIDVIRLPKNSGIAEALNAGLRHALERGYEFVARLDADDLSLPGRLKLQVERFDADESIVAVGTWTEFVDEEGRQRYVQAGSNDDKALKRTMRFTSPYSHPSLMFRTRIAMALGGYPNRFTNLAEDYDFLWKLAGCGKFSIIEKPLVRCTITRTGLSLSRRRDQLDARLFLQLENFDLFSPHAWAGLLTTLALQYLPTSFVTEVKSLFRPKDVGRPKTPIQNARIVNEHCALRHMRTQGEENGLGPIDYKGEKID